MGLNIDLTLGNSSVVKFGGYDESALKGELNIFSTTTTDAWMLTAKGFSFGGNDDNTWQNEARHVVFSPDKPFLYLPPTDMMIFRKELLASYGSDLTCDEDELCSFVGKTC